MIGIIGAMDIEADYLKGLIEDKKTNVCSGIEFCSGKIFGKDVVVATSGIGTVFAALCAQTMINLYNPQVIINSGVAGALKPGMKVYDVVVADKTCQHDMDTTAFGDPPGLISGINKIYFECDERVKSVLSEAVRSSGLTAVSGTVATGDKFVADGESKQKISETFDACACEMEGGSIGQVCFAGSVPYGVLRTISDGDGGGADYEEFAPKAAENAAKIAEKFIELW